MQRALKRILPGNRFARSVTVLAGGTAMGQMIIILVSPLLTRLYSPEDFGLLAVYSSLLGILGVVASLRYQLAIPLPESDKDAAHVVVLSLLAVLGMTMLSFVIVIFFGQVIGDVLNIPVLDNYLWLLPLGLFFVGVYQIFSYWAIRNKSFPIIARTRVVQSLSMVTVQVVGFALGPIALMIGFVCGRAAGTISLGRLAISTHRSLFKKTRFAIIRTVARRYKHFPIYSSWEGLFNKGGWELPPLLFSAFFGASVAGIYMLAHRVLAMPMSLIGKAVADVFFSQASESRRKGQLAPLVAGIHEKLANIAMPLTLILILTGQELFIWIFGVNWRQSGLFAQWMAPWIYLVLVTSPLSTLFAVMEKQAQGMLFQLILLSIRMATLLIGAYYNDVILAVALFSLGNAIYYFVLLLWIMRVSGNSLTVLWNSTMRAFGWGLLLVTPLIALHFMEDQIALRGGALIVSGSLIIVRYISLFKKDW